MKRLPECRFKLQNTLIATDFILHVICCYFTKKTNNMKKLIYVIIIELLLFSFVCYAINSNFSQFKMLGLALSVFFMFITPLILTNNR